MRKKYLKKVSSEISVLNGYVVVMRDDYHIMVDIYTPTQHIQIYDHRELSASFFP